MRTLKGPIAIIATTISVLFSALYFYTSGFGVISAQIHRGVFVLATSILCYRYVWPNIGRFSSIPGIHIQRRKKLYTSYIRFVRKRIFWNHWRTKRDISWMCRICTSGGRTRHDKSKRGTVSGFGDKIPPDVADWTIYSRLNFRQNQGFKMK